jgi:hypothetical protein
MARVFRRQWIWIRRIGRLPLVQVQEPRRFSRGDSIYTAFMSQGSNGLARVWLSAAHLGTGQLAYNRMLNEGVPSTSIQNYVHDFWQCRYGRRSMDGKQWRES